MNGAHDLGGMHGFGPVVVEPNEPVFHADWERRTFALNMAMGALRRWNLDMGRYARELMPPVEYLATTYYEHWLFGLELLLEQVGLVEPDELARVGRAPDIAHPPGWVAAVKEGAMRLDDVDRLVHRRRGARLDDPVAPRNIHPVGHTRLPRYVRGRTGIIDRDHGVFIFPDTHAAGKGAQPQHVYSVRFDARELWGTDASPRDHVYVDLWDDYLDPPEP